MTTTTDILTNSSGVFTICLTGGPCGGKSTVQALISDKLENLGYCVYRVSETASFLLGGGVLFSKLTASEAIQFQQDVLQCMIQNENTYLHLAQMHASRGLKVVLICDRGTMDSSAYVERKDWLNILERLGHNEIALRDQRYDCVIHLVSAALGAEEFYSALNNSARSEDLELARYLESRVAQAWLGHPYVDVVDNSFSTFEEKIHRVLEIVLHRLGEVDPLAGFPHPTKIKYKLKTFPNDDSFTVSFRDFYVEHAFLHTNDGTQARIRKRGHDGVFVYTLTSQKIINGRPVEIRRTLLPKEYESLSLQRDMSRHVIVKKRRCFQWQGKFYQLDLFHEPRNGLVLLETYQSNNEVASSLPPFVVVEEDVTNRTNVERKHVLQLMTDNSRSLHLAKKSEQSFNSLEESDRSNSIVSGLMRNQRHSRSRSISDARSADDLASALRTNVTTELEIPNSNQPSELTHDLLQLPSPISIRTGSALWVNSALTEAAAPGSPDTAMPNDMLHALKMHSLFARASDEFLTQLANTMHGRLFNAGDMIIREGEPGRSMFLVLRGSVQVQSDDGDVELAELHQGQFFGEISMLFGVPRTATVVAKTKCLLANVSAVQLQTILQQHPTIALHIRQLAEERVRVMQERLESNGRILPTIDFEKFPLPSILDQLQMIPYFEGFSETFLSTIAQTATLRHYLVQDIIGNVYEMQNEVLLVLDGMIEMRDPDDVFPTEKLSPGQFLTDTKRMDSKTPIAVAHTDCSLIAFPMDHWVKWTAENEMFAQKYESLCSAIPVLKIDNHIEGARIFDDAKGLESSLEELIIDDAQEQQIPLLPDTITAWTENQIPESYKFGSAPNDTNSVTNSSSSSGSNSAELTQEVSRDDIGVKQAAIQISNNISGYDSVMANKIAEMTSMMPGRRRASIAVWSDAKLQQIASSKVESNSPTIRSTLRESVVAQKELSNYSLVMSSMSLSDNNEKILPGGVTESCLIHIMSFLNIASLMRVRGVCRTWLRVSRNSLLCNTVDLSIVHKRIDNTSLATITSFVGGRLRWLSLKNCWNVGNDGLKSVAEYALHLEVIDLHSCWEVTEVGLIALVANCKFLKAIDLSNCRKIDDNCVQTLLNGTMIVDMAFSYCKILTNNVMLYISKLCPQVRRLNLQRCTGINDSGFVHLKGLQFIQLEELNLSDCSFLTDATIEIIASACPNLLRLNLSFCCGLTEKALTILGQSTCASSLESLDLSFCGSAVSNSSIEEYIDLATTQNGHIERLSLRGCVRVTEDTIKMLVAKAICLRVVNMSSCKNIPMTLLQSLAPRHWILLDNGHLDSATIHTSARRFTY